MRGRGMPPGADLTPKQRKAVAALIACRTQAEAAAMAGVGVRTLKRWLAEDTAFRAAHTAALRDLVAKASADLSRGASAAAEALLDVAVNGESESARVQAAGKLLDHALRYSEFSDVLAALTALEEANRNV